jgi:hypothetical protein
MRDKKDLKPEKKKAKKKKPEKKKKKSLQFCNFYSIHK